MKEFFECVISSNGMAYGTGVLIFLITLFLASKRVIGFTLTLLFLIFALVAAIGVANQDLIRNYLQKLSHNEKSTSGAYQAEGTNKEAATFSDQLQKAYNDLKEEFEIYKKKVQDYLEQQKEGKNPPPPAAPSQPQNPPSQ